MSLREMQPSGLDLGRGAYHVFGGTPRPALSCLRAGL